MKARDDDAFLPFLAAFGDCLAHRAFLNPAAQGQKLVEFRVAHFSDAKAALLQPFHEAVGRQQAQRLPNWRGAPAVVIAQQVDLQLEPGS